MYSTQKKARGQVLAQEGKTLLAINTYPTCSSLQPFIGIESDYKNTQYLSGSHYHTLGPLRRLYHSVSLDSRPRPTA